MSTCESRRMPTGATIPAPFRAEKRCSAARDADRDGGEERLPFRSAERIPSRRNAEPMIRAVEDRPRPEDMRRAMGDYVRTVHESYVSQAELQPPAVRGRMPLLGTPFTVVAAGVRNLHVVATRERLGAPVGPEV